MDFLKQYFPKLAAKPEFKALDIISGIREAHNVLTGWVKDVTDEVPFLLRLGMQSESDMDRALIVELGRRVWLNDTKNKNARQIIDLLANLVKDIIGKVGEDDFVPEEFEGKCAKILNTLSQADSINESNSMQVMLATIASLIQHDHTAPTKD